MLKHNLIFIGMVLGVFSPGFADSLLQPVSFPKTFEDVPFVDRMAVLAEGYAPFDPVYDTETGRCISGCPYVGINLNDDIEQTNQATLAALEDLVKNHDWVVDSETGAVHPADDNTKHGNVMAGTINYNAASMIASQESINNECIQRNRDVPYGNPLGKIVKITSNFGARVNPTNKSRTQFHKGIDLAAPMNSPVYATANGIVEFAGWDKNGGGNYISIKHNGSYRTQYLHLNEILVNKGDKVQGGYLIGKSGNSGSHTTGPHLDYRVYKDNQATNPLLYLKCTK